LKKTLSALLKLTRYTEYSYFVLITTLVGVATARGTFSARLVAVMGVNVLAISFAYMFNDLEDAAEDVFSTKNCQRNPITTGQITPQTAKLAVMIVGLIATVCYAMLGLGPFIFGAGCLILGFFYSHKTIRLKSIPLINSITRGLLLAGLPFLTSYFSFASAFNRAWCWPFLWLISLTILFRQRSEAGEDGRAGLSRLDPSADHFGEKSSNLMMTIVIIVSAATGFVSFFLINLIPSWVTITVFLLLILMLAPPYIRYRRGETSTGVQGILFNALERALAMGLMAQFILPWLVRWFS
jgi:4-hydroxybenzoate polyprenyltransferase